MRICVFIVDDERQLLGALARGTVDKWVVTLCADAKSALEVLRSPAEFDAIVLDLFLGGTLSGQEIYEQLLNDPATSARCPRVCFQTAGYDHESLIPWFRKHNRPVLTKPVSLDEFERVVTKVASWKGPRGPSFNLQKRPDDAGAFLTHLEERVVAAIHDAAAVRGVPSSDPPRTSPTSGGHHTLAALADDAGDESAQRSATGNHIVIPAGSWLEREVDKILERREKLAALELAAGRWATLRRWWFEWWRRLAVAIILLTSGAVARELGDLVKFIAKHVH